VIRLAVLALAATLAVASPGCTQGERLPDLGGIYSRAAQFHDGRRNPVIVIPGILGTKLHRAETHQVVWGAFGGDAVDPRQPPGAQAMALPMAEGRPLAALKDNIHPAGVLDSINVKVLGLSVEMKAYVRILSTLGVGGYRDQGLGMSSIDYGDKHYTCFQFDYDWRRDNAENAARLHRFIQEKSKYVSEERARRFNITDEPVTFDIVAHSMGGLVARYYLRYGDQPLPDDGSLPELTWAGAKHVRRLVTVGTPNAGSIDSVQSLVDGVEFFPILPSYEPALLGTMPSIYQLLPRPRHRMVVDAAGEKPVDLYDTQAWQDRGWGLADPDQDTYLQWLLPGEKDPARRRAIALDHLGKCLAQARAFHRALDQPATPPPGTTLHSIAGDAVSTASSLVVDATGGITVQDTAPGDGTVLRQSVLLDERPGSAKPWTPVLRTPIRWNTVTFLFTDHLALTSDPAFTDNVLYLLLEAPP